MSAILEETVARVDNESANDALGSGTGQTTGKISGGGSRAPKR